MSIHSLRERINLLIYDSKQTVLTRLKYISLIISFIAVCLLMYSYGFPKSESSESIISGIIQGTFAFYVFHYVLRLFYDFSPLKFLKRSWFEGLIVIVLIVEAGSYNVFDTLLLKTFFVSLGFENFSAFSALFIQIYLLIVVATDLGRSNVIISKIKLNPSTIFMLSFAIITAIGTALLMMPEMTVQQGSMNFIDALFTSTSATCVTGLIVVDTATFFTFKGQFVILLLMKLGGLNIISFAVILPLLSRFGVGIKHHSIIEDFLSRESIFGAKGMFAKIFAVSIFIEAIGSFLIYSLLDPSLPLKTLGDKIFFAVFHSVSAFNNAGFSTFTDGFVNEHLQQSYLMHIVIAGLIFAGAIGITTLFDLFSIGKLRDRLKHPWKRPHMSTRIAVNVSVVLTLITAIVFFLGEQKNVLEDQNFLESTITALFQSVSARSAGLSTVNMSDLTVPVIIVIIFMMFVGGSTYSTAGGIKTSTFMVLILSAYATMRGKSSIEIHKRTIPKDDLHKAFSIFLFSLGGTILGVFILSITESHILAMPEKNIIDIVFEQVSAFSTCGLSTGVTPMLSDAGKTIVAVSMFIGRIGTLTVLVALSKKMISTNYKFPEEHIMVG